MKRTISKAQYDFLQAELAQFERAGTLAPEQVETMLSNYETKANLNFIRLLLVVGSVLVGVGVLSFIAGNWSLLPKTAKFIIILAGLFGFYLAGWSMEETSPKTARSMYYIGMFVYGAGIFLIGQMFHLGSDYHNAFLVWTVGVIPLAFYLQDKWLWLFSIVLMAIYGNVWDFYGSYPWALLVFIPLVYWVNTAQMARSRLLFFFNNLLALLLLIVTLDRLHLDGLWITMIVFLLGVLMVFLPLRSYAETSIWQGSLFHGIAGVMLTFPDSWRGWLGIGVSAVPSIIFAIAYMLFLLWLLKKDNLAAILILCILIFRFYVDISYDFLPKSLFFVVGGGILIAFGYWFEKKRRKGGVSE